MLSGLKTGFCDHLRFSVPRVQPRSYSMVAKGLAIVFVAERSLQTLPSMSDQSRTAKLSDLRRDTSMSVVRSRGHGTSHPAEGLDPQPHVLSTVQEPG